MFQIIAKTRIKGDTSGKFKEVRIGQVYASKLAAIELKALLEKHGPGQAVKVGHEVVEYNVGGVGHVKG
jgi:hypothetical protein